VNRAGANHHQQPVIRAGKDRLDLSARARDQRGAGLVERQLVLEQGRGHERLGCADAQVGGRRMHGKKKRSRRGAGGHLFLRVLS